MCLSGKMSVRDLVAELTRIEDAIRSIPGSHAMTDRALATHPEMARLAAREAEVVAALRGLTKRKPPPV